MNKTYSRSRLVEINAHSLFSKWFSESGKLVMKMFDDIKTFADSGEYVFVLMDEVESLTAARQASIAGSEPSDAVRVVNVSPECPSSDQPAVMFFLKKPVNCHSTAFKALPCNSAKVQPNLAILDSRFMIDRSHP